MRAFLCRVVSLSFPPLPSLPLPFPFSIPGQPEAKRSSCSCFFTSATSVEASRGEVTLDPKYQSSISRKRVACRYPAVVCNPPVRCTELRTSFHDCRVIPHQECFRPVTQAGNVLKSFVGGVRPPPRFSRSPPRHGLSRALHASLPFPRRIRSYLATPKTSAVSRIALERL